MIATAISGAYITGSCIEYGAKSQVEVICMLCIQYLHFKNDTAPDICLLLLFPQVDNTITTIITFKSRVALTFIVAALSVATAVIKALNSHH
jgi:hypothetical protein